MRQYDLLEFPTWPGIRKVISGGQCGADYGGLVCAKRFNIPTGGWAPLGWKTADGNNPSLAEFGLIEHPASEYAPRTKANVSDADATLIIASNAHSPGCLLTRKTCMRLDKPVLVLHPKDCAVSVSKTVDWLASHRVGVLNVAGNRDFSDRNSTLHFDSTVSHLSAVFVVLADQNLLDIKK